MTHAPPVILQVDRRLGETRLLRTELRRRGATVVMTDRAGDAIEIARRSPPDLLVLDEDMEAATGIDLTGHFRSTYPEAGLILLSSRPGSIPLGVGLGLLYHGLRPVSSATLLDLAGRALEGRLVESEPPSEPGPLVMCVDDDPAALKSLSRILGSHGYRVATFQDSQGALGAIPEIGPDVAVIDVLMPGMDGRELSKQIRERYRGLFPIVMHSARTTDADRAAGFRYGADYYLPKPCDPHQLLDVVDYYADHLDPEERLFLECRI